MLKTIGKNLHNNEDHAKSKSREAMTNVYKNDLNQWKKFINKTDNQDSNYIKFIK